jgi:uncharacterized membrane protein YidH (DUF202 family)
VQSCGRPHDAQARTHLAHDGFRPEDVPMIQNLSDSAANERTFLAWVRTAIAVMACGFLVAKFDLFPRIAARSLAPRRHASGVRTDFALAGLRVILGVAMVLYRSQTLLAGP